jgi:hypothetical protein
MRLASRAKSQSRKSDRTISGISALQRARCACRIRRRSIKSRSCRNSDEVHRTLWPQVPDDAGADDAGLWRRAGFGRRRCGRAGSSWRRLVERARFEQESAKVPRPDVGAGFISWTIPQDPGLLNPKSSDRAHLVRYALESGLLRQFANEAQ